MSCGCNKCNQLTPTCNTCACPQCTAVCTALVVANSWNVPACGQYAILSIPGLTTVLIGSYIFNPTYGQFKITAFDSLNSLVTVLNECLPDNAAPGTVVPALTSFVFSGPATFVNLSSSSSWVVPACDASVVIDVPGLNSVVIGSFIWNPGYGYFRVTAFNNVTDKLTVVNDCFEGNAAPGTVVPVSTPFLFVDGPPSPEADDGWREAREDWTYASATSINVPSDATAKYAIGDKVWIVQGGVDKYFSIVGVAATLLTVTAGDDNSVANAAIDTPKYSHEQSPVNFPPFFNWTPVITASGAMTVSNVNNVQNRIRVVGGYAEFDTTNIFDLGGVSDTQVFVSLPFDVMGDISDEVQYPANVIANGVHYSGSYQVNSAPEIRFIKQDASNWALGGGAFASAFGRTPI